METGITIATSRELAEDTGAKVEYRYVAKLLEEPIQPESEQPCARALASLAENTCIGEGKDLAPCGPMGVHRYQDEHGAKLVIDFGVYPMKGKVKKYRIIQHHAIEDLVKSILLLAGEHLRLMNDSLATGTPLVELGDKQWCETGVAAVKVAG